MKKWAYVNSLGMFELEKRNNEYYIPNTYQKVTKYFDTEEEAKIHYYNKIVKKYNSEKRELEKRIKKLKQLQVEANQLFQINELKKSHPEHFLSND